MLLRDILKNGQDHLHQDIFRMTAYYVAQYLRFADVVARLDAQPHRSIGQQSPATTNDTVEQDCADLQVDLFIDSLVNALKTALAHGLCCKAEHFRGLNGVRRQETIKDELIHGAQSHVSNDACAEQSRRIVSIVLKAGGAALRGRESCAFAQTQQRSRERVKCSCTARLLGLDNGQERLEVHQGVDFADLCPRRYLTQGKVESAFRGVRSAVQQPAPERNRKKRWHGG